MLEEWRQVRTSTRASICDHAVLTQSRTRAYPCAHARTHPHRNACARAHARRTPSVPFSLLLLLLLLLLPSPPPPPPPPPPWARACAAHADASARRRARAGADGGGPVRRGLLPDAHGGLRLQPAAAHRQGRPGPGPAPSSHARCRFALGWIASHRPAADGGPGPQKAAARPGRADERARPAFRLGP